MYCVSGEVDALTWEVLLPSRRAASLSTTAKPRATLVVTTESRGEEHISLPLPVGKVLKAKADADELHPESRAELLYEVREVSNRCAS